VNVVTDVKAELVGLRAKVDEAIAHVESGVRNLNEDQVRRLDELFAQIQETAEATESRVAGLLGKVRTTDGLPAEQVISKAGVASADTSGPDLKPEA